MERGDRRARERGGCSAPTCSARPRLRPRGARRRRRLCLRRGDLAARKPRGQARPGARQAAAAGASRACSASRPSSTTCSRSPPCRSSWPRAPRPIADFGMGRSRGTMPIQLAGNIKHGGLFETAFGITLGELVDDIGGGTLTGRPVRAVQVGGPLGAYFPRALFDTPFDYEAFAAARRPDRPWRHRGVRRHRRHGAAGALRLGVLRHRELRQVHALPHRLDARRRDDRQDHRRARTSPATSRCSRTSARR